MLLSHGLGANVRGLGWLAAGLAERGAVVVAVNHPGSTTGDVDMGEGLRHWTRVEDLGAVIDYLPSDPELGPHVDTSRVFAAGFSLGGWTALSAGGLTGDLEGYARHCEAVGEGSTHCRDIARAGVDLGALDAEAWDRSRKDDRVQAVAAIDPGFLYGLTEEDAAGLVDDVLLVALGEGQDRLLATDFGPSGSGFEDLAPQAETLVVAPASHHAAMPTCTPTGPAILEEEGDDPVCSDPEGADRDAIHAQMVSAIAEAFGLD